MQPAPKNEALRPCTTFDKWRLLWMVDDVYRVADGIWTYF